MRILRPFYGFLRDNRSWLLSGLGVFILALIVGGGSSIITYFLKKEPQPAYSERLSELTQNLVKSSSEVDKILTELTKVSQEREQSVQKLESELADMENREKQLQGKIDSLENLPIPVAEYFAEIVEAGERRSAYRDYILFGSGVIVTTVIAILIQALTSRRKRSPLEGGFYAVSQKE